MNPNKKRVFLFIFIRPFLFARDKLRSDCIDEYIAEQEVNVRFTLALLYIRNYSKQRWQVQQGLIKYRGNVEKRLQVIG